MTVANAPLSRLVARELRSAGLVYGSVAGLSAVTALVVGLVVGPPQRPAPVSTPPVHVTPAPASGGSTDPLVATTPGKRPTNFGSIADPSKPRTTGTATPR